MTGVQTCALPIYQGRLIEIQGTGEERPFTLAEQQELVRLCEKGIRQLQEIQKEILG